jgi:hypothetical protein
MFTYFPKAHTLVKMAHHFQTKWAQGQVLSNSRQISVWDSVRSNMLEAWIYCQRNEILKDPCCWKLGFTVKEMRDLLSKKWDFVRSMLLETWIYCQRNEILKDPCCWKLEFTVKEMRFCKIHVAGSLDLLSNKWDSERSMLLEAWIYCQRNEILKDPCCWKLGFTVKEMRFCKIHVAGSLDLLSKKWDSVRSMLLEAWIYCQRNVNIGLAFSVKSL